MNNTGDESDGIEFAPPSVGESLIADYQTTGLSLAAHPMALLRNQLPYSQCKLATGLAGLRNGQFVQIAGLVTGRQRPSTAKGTLFVTLEDETGNINLIVWSKTQETFRKPLMTSTLLLVKGRVEIADGVVHVVAGFIEDRSEDIEGIGKLSRDFH